MATQQDYTASANAILAVLREWMAANVPEMFQGQLAAALPAIAGACAKASVDAVDAERTPTA